MRQCHHCGMIGPDPICVNCHNVNIHGPNIDQEPLELSAAVALIAIVVVVIWLIGH